MRIRWKLLILLLAIALLPLGLIGWYEYRSLKRLGRELSGRARAALIQRAGRQLRQLADDYGAVLRRDGETLELVLRMQARELERHLAAEPPASPQIYWAQDYDQGGQPPPGMALSERYFRVSADGRREPVPVNYEQQVLKLAPGVDRRQVADDVARLSLAVPTYRFVRRGQLALIQWQYTALEVGIHSSYPGHGGYPEDFDPRQRGWFRNAIEADGLTWNPPMVDVSTGQVMLAVSMPIQGPDGSPVGVTAIDVRLLDVVRGVKLPLAWSADARTLLVQPRIRPEGAETGLLILAQQSYVEEGQNWDTPIRLEWLESEDRTEMGVLIEDVKARRSGLRKMPYQERDCLWAYGPVERGNFLLLIVPYEEIIAQAVAAEADVLRRMRRQLEATGVASVVVVVVIFLVALVGSRTVTRPVAELAQAVGRIARGDFAARAKIESRDELGELGRAFNDMVPQLADRLRMRESLSLAMEMQQRLLPAGPPRVEGLDVAGKSIYCDETGGDYYDFVELREMGPQRLGVAVGDVTGHGIAAALLMATARALLRSRADQPGTLAEVIGDINRHLTLDTVSSYFMTLIYLLVDVQGRTLRWVCAGHDAPIVYDPSSDSFGELGGGGIPLGISEDWTYREYDGELPAEGRIIVIGTDGIWEARNPAGEMFGKEELRRIIRDNARRSADEISRAVTDAVAAFSGPRPQEDDITLVVIKVLPQGRG